MGPKASDEELEELRATIVGGVQSVEADGRKVVFRSLDDQLRIKQLADEAREGKPRHRLTAFSKGYE